MACPLFEPTEKLSWNRWQGRFRPPLGALHGGLCHADGKPAAAPEQAVTDCCNMGYPRGRCERFTGDGPEAMRYEVAWADDDRIEIAWLAERECLPVAQGRAVYDRLSATWLHARKLAPLLRTQLDAYLRAWLEAGTGS